MTLVYQSRTSRPTMYMDRRWFFNHIKSWITHDQCWCHKKIWLYNFWIMDNPWLMYKKWSYFSYEIIYIKNAPNCPVPIFSWKIYLKTTDFSSLVSYIHKFPRIQDKLDTGKNVNNCVTKSWSTHDLHNLNHRIPMHMASHDVLDCIYISLGVSGALAVTVGGKQSIRWNCRLYRWYDYDNTTHSNTPN